MSTTVRVAKKRHQRHEPFGRIHRRRRLLSWLGQQATRLTASITAVTISAVTIAAKAAATLTSSANYANGATVTIDGRVYTFQTVLTNVDGNVLIGATEAASILNLHRAINATGGVPGTDYALATTAHPTVTATDDAAHVLTATAISGGRNGNLITVSETGATAAWSGPRLTGGTSGSLTSAAHGISNGEGPYRIAATTTVPAGLSASLDYWVNVVDANTFQLERPQGTESVLATITSVGAGTITVAKPGDARGVFDLLFRNKAATIQAASDIDSLK